MAAFDAYRAPWSPHHVDGSGGLFVTVPAGPDGILTEAGNPPLWRAYSAEGHGLFKTENRADFMTQREGSLAQHLAPK